MSHAPVHGGPPLGSASTLLPDPGFWGLFLRGFLQRKAGEEALPTSSLLPPRLPSALRHADPGWQGWHRRDSSTPGWQRTPLPSQFCSTAMSPFWKRHDTEQLSLPRRQRQDLGGRTRGHLRRAASHAVSDLRGRAAKTRARRIVPSTMSLPAAPAPSPSWSQSPPCKQLGKPGAPRQGMVLQTGSRAPASPRMWGHEPHACCLNCSSPSARTRLPNSRFLRHPPALSLPLQGCGETCLEPRCPTPCRSAEML